MQERMMLRVSEAAELIGVDDDVVLKWISNGDLIAADVSVHKAVRPRWRIRRSDLDAFISNRTASQGQQTERTARHRKSDTKPAVEYV